MGGLSVPRSSPLALQTLRDVASISAALREMQQAVRPMAEHGLPAQQSELLATLNAGVGELQQSVAALQSVAAGARERLAQSEVQAHVVFAEVPICLHGRLEVREGCVRISLLRGAQPGVEALEPRGGRGSCEEQEPGLVHHA